MPNLPNLRLNQTPNLSKFKYTIKLSSRASGRVSTVSHGPSTVSHGPWVACNFSTSLPNLQSRSTDFVDGHKFARGALRTFASSSFVRPSNLPLADCQSCLSPWNRGRKATRPLGGVLSRGSTCSCSGSRSRSPRWIANTHQPWRPSTACSECASVATPLNS